MIGAASRASASARAWLHDPHVAWLEALARVGVIITFEWPSDQWVAYPRNFLIQIHAGPPVSVSYEPCGGVFHVHAWADDSGRGRTFRVYAAIADPHASRAYARIREPQEIVDEIAGRARAIARELDSSGGRR